MDEESRIVMLWNYVDTSGSVAAGDSAFLEGVDCFDPYAMAAHVMGREVDDGILDASLFVPGDAAESCRRLLAEFAKTCESRDGTATT